MKSPRLPLAIAAISALALAAGLAGNALGLGLLAVALLVALCLLGLGSPGRPSAWTVAALLAFGGAFCALLLMANRLHRPSEPLETLGGIPPGTAMLLFGIAPLGLVLGMVYGLTFGREVLPEPRLKRFLARHSKG